MNLPTLKKSLALASVLVLTAHLSSFPAEAGRGRGRGANHHFSQNQEYYKGRNPYRGRGYNRGRGGYQKHTTVYQEESFIYSPEEEEHNYTDTAAHNRIVQIECPDRLDNSRKEERNDHFRRGKGRGRGYQQPSFKPKPKEDWKIQKGNPHFNGTPKNPLDTALPQPKISWKPRKPATFTPATPSETIFPTTPHVTTSTTTTTTTTAISAAKPLTTGDTTSKKRKETSSLTPSSLPPAKKQCLEKKIPSGAINEENNNFNTASTPEILNWLTFQPESSMQEEVEPTKTLQPAAATETTPALIIPSTTLIEEEKTISPLPIPVEETRTFSHSLVQEIYTTITSSSPITSIDVKKLHGQNKYTVTFTHEDLTQSIYQNDLPTLLLVEDILNKENKKKYETLANFLDTNKRVTPNMGRVNLEALLHFVVHTTYNEGDLKEDEIKWNDIFTYAYRSKEMGKSLTVEKLKGFFHGMLAVNPDSGSFEGQANSQPTINEEDILMAVVLDTTQTVSSVSSATFSTQTTTTTQVEEEKREETAPVPQTTNNSSLTRSDENPRKDSEQQDTVQKSLKEQHIGLQRTEFFVHVPAQLQKLTGIFLNKGFDPQAQINYSPASERSVAQLSVFFDHLNTLFNLLKGKATQQYPHSEDGLSANIATLMATIEAMKKEEGPIQFEHNSILSVLYNIQSLNKLYVNRLYKISSEQVSIKSVLLQQQIDKLKHEQSKQQEEIMKLQKQLLAKYEQEQLQLQQQPLYGQPYQVMPQVWMGAPIHQHPQPLNPQQQIDQFRNQQQQQRM